MQITRNSLVQLTITETRSGAQVGQETVCVEHPEGGHSVVSESVIYGASPFVQTVRANFDDAWLPTSVNLRTSMGHRIQMFFDDEGYNATAEMDSVAERRDYRGDGERGIPIITHNFFWPQVALNMRTASGSNALPTVPQGTCTIQDAGTLPGSKMRRYSMALKVNTYQDKINVLADADDVMVSYTREGLGLRVSAQNR